MITSPSTILVAVHHGGYHLVGNKARSNTYGKGSLASNPSSCANYLLPFVTLRFPILIFKDWRMLQFHYICCSDFLLVRDAGLAQPRFRNLSLCHLKGPPQEAESSQSVQRPCPLQQYHCSESSLASTTEESINWHVQNWNETNSKLCVPQKWKTALLFLKHDKMIDCPCLFKKKIIDPQHISCSCDFQ